MLFRISKLEKALRENPGIPLFAPLADEYLRRGRVARALALCQEGCERFPDYPTGFLLLARCYEARGNFEEVRNALDRALRLDPENPAAFAALSAAWERLGEITLALQCMRQAAFLEPYSGNLKREAERLRRRSAAAPLVLPPAARAVAGSVVRDELNEEDGHLEADTSEREPSPAAAGVAPPDGEAAGGLSPNPEVDEAVALPVPGRGGGEVAAEGGLSPAEDTPGEAPSGDSGPDASSSDKAEPGLRDHGQTGVFYLVSEPEEEAGAGAGEPPETPSGAVLEPEGVQVSLPGEETAGRGGEIAPPHQTGPGRPVSRLSSREDHELIGLLSEIGTAGDRAAESTVADAGGEERSAPVPTATLAELYIQQGIASKGIDIYRDLLRRHPGDDAIRGRLAVLEGGGEA